MIDSLAGNRCFNHISREAIALCSSCGRHYCKECVTEHMGRMTCSYCIERLPVKKELKRGTLYLAVRGFEMAAGLMLLWLILYYIGRLLILLPSSFHEGTFWGGG
jgi:hypothetical protein